MRQVVHFQEFVTRCTVNKIQNCDKQLCVAAVLLTCIREVLLLTLSPHTSYPDMFSVVCFSPSMEIPGCYYYNMTAYFTILYNSSVVP